MTRLFLVIGLVFAPLAALAAFLITYKEYAHRYSDRRLPLVHAFQAALFAFVVFLALTLLAGYLLARGVVRAK